MRICVFGAGAVGSHFAVRLALAGHDVSCVMRGAHLDAVKANGLTLRVGDAEFKAKVSASDDPAALGPQDAVICTLKATALPALPPAFNPCSARTPPWCSRRTAFPGGTISGFPQNIRPFRIWPFSIPAAACARRSRRSGSSAAWCFRPTKFRAGIAANLSPERNRLLIGECDDRPSERIVQLRAALNAAASSRPT